MTLPIQAATIIFVAGIAMLLSAGCQHHEARKRKTAKRVEKRDPLPGEMVKQTMIEDSMRNVKKDKLKVEMTQILKEHRDRFRQEYYNGYFVTDINYDGLPELWIKSGTNTKNSKLELYFPMLDGYLKTSEMTAEPGQYYEGEGYIIQVVAARPGVVNVNRITIHRGEMNVETIQEVDFNTDTKAKMPEIKEPELKFSSFGNSTVLYESLTKD